MQSDRLKSLFHLHFIVFLWGFTAILGKAIRMNAIHVVFYRMGIAALSFGVYFAWKKQWPKVSARLLFNILTGGALLTTHWLAFFAAIKASNVSVTLVSLSTGALFVAFIEPIVFKKKFDPAEFIFALTIIIGLLVIFNINPGMQTGIYLALLSAFFAALFTVLNGNLIRQTSAVVISFYQLTFGFVAMGLLLGYRHYFYREVIHLPSTGDLIYLLILGTICSSYAFTAGIKVMRHLSPFTVALTTNLEPVYGIILATLIFGKSEYMGAMFYFGASLIILAILLEHLYKRRNRKTAV